jgi:hypothetical protein
LRDESYILIDLTEDGRLHFGANAKHLTLGYARVFIQPARTAIPNRWVASLSSQYQRRTTAALYINTETELVQGKIVQTDPLAIVMAPPGANDARLR